MDYLELLLADRVRDRAKQFRQHAKNSHRDSIEANGGDVAMAVEEWNKQNSDDKFLKMAYDELKVAAAFIAKQL